MNEYLKYGKQNLILVIVYDFLMQTVSVNLFVHMHFLFI